MFTNSSLCTRKSTLAPKGPCTHIWRQNPFEKESPVLKVQEPLTSDTSLPKDTKPVKHLPNKTLVNAMCLGLLSTINAWSHRPWELCRQEGGWGHSNLFNSGLCIRLAQHRPFKEPKSHNFQQPGLSSLSSRVWCVVINKALEHFVLEGLRPLKHGSILTQMEKGEREGLAWHFLPASSHEANFIGFVPVVLKLQVVRGDWRQIKPHNSIPRPGFLAHWGGFPHTGTKALWGMEETSTQVMTTALTPHHHPLSRGLSPYQSSAIKHTYTLFHSMRWKARIYQALG